MSTGPYILVEEKNVFRIVRCEVDNKVTHVLEEPDGCDALGTERWKSIKLEGTATNNKLLMLASYIIKTAVKGEKGDASH